MGECDVRSVNIPSTSSTYFLYDFDWRQKIRPELGGLPSGAVSSSKQALHGCTI